MVLDSNDYGVTQLLRKTTVLLHQLLRLAHLCECV
jgi:hypothetical protein